MAIEIPCSFCGHVYMQGMQDAFCPHGWLAQPQRELKKLDSGKVPLQLVPCSLITAVGTVLAFGATKYAPRAWEEGFEWSRAYGALLRHLVAWWTGENFDNETGKSHLWHAACELAFLIEWETTHAENDDRPKGGAGGGSTGSMKAEEEKHERKLERFTGNRFTIPSGMQQLDNECRKLGSADF